MCLRNTNKLSIHICIPCTAHKKIGSPFNVGIQSCPRLVRQDHFTDKIEGDYPAITEMPEGKQLKLEKMVKHYSVSCIREELNHF